MHELHVLTLVRVAMDEFGLAPPAVSGSPSREKVAEILVFLRHAEPDAVIGSCPVLGNSTSRSTESRGRGEHLGWSPQSPASSPNQLALGAASPPSTQPPRFHLTIEGEYVMNVPVDPEKYKYWD